MKHTRLLLWFLTSILLCQDAAAQQLSEVNKKIQKDVESRNYAGAISSLVSLQSSEEKLFRLNNYDYLLARLSEKTGDRAGAATGYQAVVKRRSALNEYALWHLSTLMRATGNLPLERVYLNQFLAMAPEGLLNEAVQMRLARSYFDSRDFPAAVKMLQNIRLSPARPFQPSLLPNLAANPAFGNLNGNDPRTREALALLGKAYEQNGQRQQAREIFEALCNNLPNPAMPDDFALAGVRGLDELDKDAKDADSASPAAPSLEADHLKRAAIYQFNRDFAAARLHYRAIVEGFPRSAGVPDALYQIGRGFIQQGSFDEAIPWFERVQTEFPTHFLSTDALNQAASAYARLKRTNEAMARYQKYIALNPDSDTAERAYLNIIDIWRDEGEFTKALEWTEKTRERFNGKTTGALAIFDAAKIYLSQENWEAALGALAELQKQPDLGGTRVPGGTNKNEVLFLRAFVLEKLRRYSEAANEYLAIPDGRNEYYGWRATEHLKGLAKDPSSAAIVSAKLDEFRAAAKQAAGQNQHDIARKAAQNALRLTDDPAIVNEMTGLARRAYSALPAYNSATPGKMQSAGRQEVLKNKTSKAPEAKRHQLLADELLFLGLYDEAAPELETAFRQKLPGTTGKTAPSNNSLANPLADFPPDTAYTLAVYYLRGDMPHRATAYIEPFLKKLPDDYLLELAPREPLEMLYPAPFAESLLAEAAPRGVDARFVLSIMRQESRYRPDVKSAAAARGLMQFISLTADTVAAQLGKTDFRQDELYHPATAVMFGSQYIKNLFDLFPDQPQAVAASYNGGEQNMARWLKRTHSPEADLYVPEIVFSQSKDYVYKVMANYRAYRALYDDKLKPLKTSQ